MDNETFGIVAVGVLVLLFLLSGPRQPPSPYRGIPGRGIPWTDSETSQQEHDEHHEDEEKP